MRAKIRKDLVEQGLLPSVQIVDQNGVWVTMNLPKDMLEVEFDSHQPDSWDAKEYNTIILDVESGRSFSINSIELDFIDKPLILVRYSTNQSSYLSAYASPEVAVKRITDNLAIHTGKPVPKSRAKDIELKIKQKEAVIEFGEWNVEIEYNETIYFN